MGQKQKTEEKEKGPKIGNNNGQRRIAIIDIQPDFNHTRLSAWSVSVGAVVQ